MIRSRRRDRAVVVRSRLPPAGAIARLAAGRIGGRWYPRFTAAQGLRPVIVGTVTEQRVRLTVHRGGRPRWWHPVLRGVVEPTPDGCALVASFGLRRSRADEQLLRDWLSTRLGEPVG